MRHRARSAAIVIACALFALLAPPFSRAALAALTIAETAPKNSFLIFGADDAAKAKAAFDRSAFRSLWDDEEFAQWRRQISAALSFDPLGGLERAGVDVDSVSFPSRAVGGALFMAGPDDGAGVDDGVGRQIHGLFLADYGDDADAAAAMVAALERVVEQAERDSIVTRDTLDHDGVEITRLVIDFEALDRFIDEQAGIPAADDRAAPEDEEFGFDEHEFRRSRLAEGDLPASVMFARVGGVALASSHLASLKESIDRAEGHAPASGAGETPEFRRALAQHDPGFHAYIYAPGAALGEALLASDSGADVADMAMPGAGVMSEWGARLAAPLGIDRILALSAAWKIDAPQSQGEGSIAMLMDEKRGLFSLVDGPGKQIAAPTFVPADGAMLLSQRIDASRLLPLLREVTAALPPEERGTFEAGLDLFAQQFEPALNALGAEFTLMSRIERPYSAESMRMLAAMSVDDQAELAGALGALGAAFGFEPRDFQGNQIWESPLGPALGLGFGRLFIGDARDIENALREAGDPERAKFDAEPGVRRVIDALGGPAIGFQVSRMRPNLEWSDWQTRNMERIWSDELEGAGWTAQERDEFIAQMKQSTPAWSRVPPPVSALLRHFGDSGMSIRSTPDGFVARWVVLAPAN